MPQNFLFEEQNFPDELKRVPQWVGANGDKRPLNVMTGEHAKVNDLSTAAAFPTALGLAMQREYLTLGFIITPPYIGIDLDNCVRDGKIVPFAQKIIARLKSYTEYSISGKGLHIICKGTLPESKKVNVCGVSVEVYTSGRFLVCTGQTLAGFPQVSSPGADLKDIYDLIEQAHDVFKQAHDDDKFSKLYLGMQNGEYPSQSEADLALCSKLAFYTRNDQKAIDRLFRQSGLMREKWDERHFSGGQTYGQETIGKAIQSAPPAASSHTPPNVTETGIDPNRIAAQILAEKKMIYSGGSYYEYFEGVFSKVSAITIKKTIKARLNGRFRENVANEVLHSLEVEAGCEIDELNATNLLNVRNGMLNLDTLALIPHSPDVKSTIQLPVSYDPAAVCPKWERALSEIFADCPNKISVLQEFLGLCLTKETRFERGLFFLGEGANGKSTILHVQQQILGQANYSSIPLETFQNAHYTANLIGKLANISIETNAKSSVYDSMFKAIISGDMISADFKYGQVFQFRPYCKLIFALNNMPRVDDKTSAFYRRLIIIRFSREFKPEEQNKRLKYDLEQELDGIFNWMIQGWKRLNERGDFALPESVQKEVEEYRKENNNTMGFIEEECTLSPELTITKQALYNRYAEYCKEDGFRALSKKKFGCEVLRYKQIEGGFNTSGTDRIWKGIGLRGKSV